MKKTYLFYDLETTGLNKAFDQVLQFAAIRTDMALNEIERHEILIKLNPDVVPTPIAMITHQIRLDEIAQGLPEYEAIKKIHTLINTPGTISLGYNTLTFDDEFLRFSFYRNLLPPYTHQYANQCSRMDLYPITLMFYLFKPEVLNWPKNGNKTSLKLEDLNKCNQLAEGQAHNALVDVEVTLALARILKSHSDMWDYLTGYFDKKEDLARITKLPSAFKTTYGVYKQALLIQGSVGVAKKFQVPVLSLGQHNHYKNQTLWLRLDDAALKTTTTDNIAENTWVERKRAGEAPLLLPPSQRFLQHITHERQTIVDDNLAWLKDHPELLDQICQYHKAFTYPPVPNLDLDAALYENGFLSFSEQMLCEQLHKAGATKMSALIDTFPENLKEQGIRMLGRNYPGTLTPEQKEIFTELLAHINPEDSKEALIDYRGKPKLTLKAAQADIASLRKDATLDEHQQTILTELEKYLAKFAEVAVRK